MSSIEDFMAWQAESPDTRSVNVKIYPNSMTIWVYDDSIPHSGHFVECVEDIDLEGTAKLHDIAEIERIRERYKGTEG